MQDSSDLVGRNAQIVRLLAAHNRSLMSYIFTLVPNRADAEDILHDTIVVILEKYAEFEEGSSFLAWARAIAYHRVGNFIQKKGASTSAVFDDQLRASVAAQWERSEQDGGERLNALKECLEELPDRSKRMLLARYEPGGSAAVAAELLGYSRLAAYKALSRLRRALGDCVKRKMESART